MLSANEHNSTFIDLFSGAGGFSCGFSMAGFHDLLAIELNTDAAMTYRNNFPFSVVINDDIRHIHSLTALNLIKHKTVDVIIASPPCEPFTAASKKRRSSPWSRFFEDPEGDLVFHAIRFIADLEPKFFVIENVVPMIAGEAKEILKETFTDIGYQVFFNVIEAQKYGCPSARTRVFLSNIKLKLPKHKTITVKDAFSDLPSPYYPSDVPNHFIIPLPARIEKKIYTIAKYRALIYFEGANSEKKNWIKLDPDMPAPTVMGKSRFVHPTEPRALTVREHARLMTFPDNFVFIGDIESMYNQVGEAVPPHIAFLIANEIKKRV